MVVGVHQGPILVVTFFRLGKIRQAIHHASRAVYCPYRLSSRLIWPLALRTSLGATAILAKF